MFVILDVNGIFVKNNKHYENKNPGASSICP